MRLPSIALRLAVLAVVATSLCGCLAAAVVGTAAGVAGAAVGATTKVAGETIHVGHMGVNAVTGGGAKKSDKAN